MPTVKALITCTAAAFVTAGLGFGVSVAAPASSIAAPPPAAAAKAKAYQNCAALNKVYKYGVKKSSSTEDVVRSGGKTTKKTSRATVNKALYAANTKLDRDKDGIACEK